MRSLKARLVGLWCLSLLSGLVLAVLLVGLYRQSSEAQVGRSQAVLARACDLIRDRYGFYVAGWGGPDDAAADPALRRDLVAAVSLALLRQDGVEGGIWVPGTGSLAYAYPTYEGSGAKTDLPAAEAEQIAAVNTAASRTERTVGRTVAARTQTLLLAACPLDGPIPGATAWVMTRVQNGGVLRSMQAGLSVLLVLLVLTSLLLWRTTVVWGRHVGGIEAALNDGGGVLPAVPRPGERELDRIVDALNLAGSRLAEARREAEALAGQVARSERLAGLGRVAAGVAHEIRNPLAAARLQGENALAGNDERRKEAIGDMLEQLDRLDGLASELLAMTQRVQPTPARMELGPFLDSVAARHQAAASAKDVELSIDAARETVSIDPVVVGRILDNLLGNAIRHVSRHGRVALSGRVAGGTLTVAVADNGSGVSGELAETLFEPFVTGRADGTGLGLAIARELADAHGGRLMLRSPGTAGTLTDFALELPQ